MAVNIDNSRNECVIPFNVKVMPLQMESLRYPSCPDGVSDMAGQRRNQQSSEGDGKTDGCESSSVRRYGAESWRPASNGMTFSAGSGRLK